MKTNFFRLFAVLALSVVAVTSAQADPPLGGIKLKKAKELMKLHYSAYGVGADAQAVFPQSTAEGWKSCGSNGADCQDREQLAGQLKGLKQVLPDMKWEILDVMVSNDKVVVRGQGSGTPTSDFMGIPRSGKRFQIMSIDIHTISKGKISHSFHLEDWATALRQLSEK